MSRREEPGLPGRLVEDGFYRIVRLAPIVFTIHFLEEGPWFVPWFNAHGARGITPELFWPVNLTALVITVLLAISVRISRSAAVTLLGIAWLSFLMLTNAIFHIAGAVVDRGYVPGLVTAVLLYLPYCGWLGIHLARTRALPAGAIGVAALIGGLPMAVHGYRILFWETGFSEQALGASRMPHLPEQLARMIGPVIGCGRETTRPPGGR